MTMNDNDRYWGKLAKKALENGFIGGGASKETTKIEILVNRVNAGESVGVLSIGEQIAAALIFNRLDWLPDPYKHPLDALDRLGANWLGMVLEYHRSHS